MASADQASGVKGVNDWTAHIGSHVGITVPNMDEGRQFYCDTLGFRETATYEAAGPSIEEMTKTPGAVVKTAMLETPGGSRIQMQTFEPSGSERTMMNMNDHGLTHLSFGVEDVRAEYDRLLAVGVTFRNEPVALRFEDEDHAMNGLDAVYFEDPWGLPLEFIGPTA